MSAGARVWRVLCADIPGFPPSRPSARALIDESELPEPVRDRVWGIVRRTKLWESEQREVCRELIAHFAEGIARGRTPSELMESFGDERVAARLITRSCRRKRPWLWHGFVYARRTVGAALGVLLGIYLWYGVLVWFSTEPPAIVARVYPQLDRSEVPEEERAWPLFLEARLRLGYIPFVGEIDQPSEHLLSVENASPHWPVLVAFLCEHRAEIEAVREGAGRPRLGFSLSREESEALFEVQWERTPPELSGLVEHPGSEYAHFLKTMTTLRSVLLADIRVAAHERDAERLVGSFEALAGIDRLQPGWGDLDKPPLYVVNRLTGIIGTLIARGDHGLNDAQLSRIQEYLLEVNPQSYHNHRINRARKEFAVRLDEIYAQTPFGSGVLSREAAASYSGGSTQEQSLIRSVLESRIGQPLLTAMFPTRRQAARRFQESQKRVIDNLGKPLWKRERFESPPSVPEAEEYKPERPYSLQPLLRMRESGSSFPHEHVYDGSTYIERICTKSEGLAVGIALERFRAATGAYPGSLDQLVPDYLSSIPVDRWDGCALRYLLRAPDDPVVYSVGANRIDDHGALPVERYRGESPSMRNSRAAAWLSSTEIDEMRREDPDAFNQRYAGDWILWPPTSD